MQSLADNKAASAATDALTNIESVKHFGNEGFELSRYTTALKAYEKAAVCIEG
jgi:ATP-binding cassette, subfamily B (MDR/TAP), member 7